MVNNRGKFFIYQRYILGVQKIVDDMFSELGNSKSSCSISSDFMNRFLIIEKAVENVSKSTILLTNFEPVLSIAAEIIRERNDIICDVGKIKKMCDDFKNCSVGIRNYRNEFKKICDDYRSVYKDFAGAYNVNIFFLKFMIWHNNFSVSLIQNVLKYRICPQLRLIAQYRALLGKKENIKMEEILKSINKPLR